MASVLFGCLVSFSTVGAVLIETCAAAAQLIQPWLMKKMLECVFEKAVREEMQKAYKLMPELFPGGYPSDMKFPYEYGITMILMPLTYGFLDAFATRLFIHFVGRLRATCAALVYSKTLRLNITAQSDVNVGRILALISTDCHMIGDVGEMLMTIVILPIKFIVPFVLVTIDLKWATTVTLAVVLTTVVIECVLVAFIAAAMKKYFYFNDERNKVINESFQGIRVIKYSGLESVFIRKIERLRRVQASTCFGSSLGFHTVVSVMRALPVFVNCATFAVYVKAFDVLPEEFTLKVMPSVGYLQIMTQPLLMFPVTLQYLSILFTIITRMRDFLVLPELKREVVQVPTDKQYAITVAAGTFQWGPPPEIPLSVQEAAQLAKDKAQLQQQQQNSRRDRKIYSVESSSSSFSSSSFTSNANPSFDERSSCMSSLSPPPRSASLGGANRRKRSRSSSHAHSRSRLRSPSPSPPSSLSMSSWELPRTRSSSASSSLSIASREIPRARSPQISLARRRSSHRRHRRRHRDGSKMRAALRNISLNIVKGSLIMVVGGVGCGKSSLGCALIGDIERKQGVVCIAGSVAYCPQTAWINSNTIRGNIIFGMPYNAAKYAEVVRVCSLEADFRILASGDQTAIGEKGVNLSGGQKARIQLARAVYADRDIYVLDDPLSAVDSHVGSSILEQCICGRLASKTRVLMTNQLQFLDRADNVVVLAKGEIVAQGRYDELKARGIDFSKYIMKGGEEEEDDDDDEEESSAGEEEDEEEKRARRMENKSQGKTEEKKSVEEPAQQILTEEEQAVKSVGWAAYFRFFRALMPPFVFVLFILFSVLINSVQAFTYYWLGKIGAVDKFTGFTFWWKIRIYALLGTGMLAVMCIRAVWSALAVERACNHVHSDLLNSIMHCPEVFFNTTPLGRLLNRFGGDMAVVDQNLFTSFIQTLSFWLELFGYVLVIAIDTISFLFVGLPALLAYYILLVIFQRCSRNLQRIETIASSPVVSLFSETISGAGLSTIRAYRLENEWRNRFFALNDAWTTRFVLYWVGQKWATMVCSLIGTLFMAGVILFGWYRMKVVDLAIAISAAMIISFISPSMILNNVEFQSNMTSAERIFFYSTKLPQEKSHPKTTNPPKWWPKDGCVEFDHVSFRYRPGLPYVLNDVSIRLRKNEKVGVCGRTGAGKSSLLFALFRLVELDPTLQPVFYDINTGLPVESTFKEPPNKGRVLIDGVDISLIPLDRLRSSVSIIPQDPTLFTGSVRSNLDLTCRCTDERIWQVLDMVEMRQHIMRLGQALDTEVAEGGSNFSCGQRQLLCFARAILNDCRIVIMDEATASVDVETDAKIQYTIQNQFKNQTVIVIAHRLNTIMHSDRILVMEAGRVAEFDTPANLQARPDSALNALLHSLTH